MIAIVAGAPAHVPAKPDRDLIVGGYRFAAENAS
jgi:hypothetical protein